MVQLHLFGRDRFSRTHLRKFENASRIVLISLISRLKYAAVYVRKINYAEKDLYAI